jgi:hypothetical protein
MKYINKAYVLLTTIFIVALISTFLLITFLWVDYYLGKANKNANEVVRNNKYFKILDKIIDEFSSDVKEDYTSPYDGWFSELPKELDKYTVKYFAEDSKFDINHIDIEQLGKNRYFKKKIGNDKYFYYPWEILPFLNKDIREKYDDVFSIYRVPNLNVSKVEKIKLFMDSQSIPEGISKSIIERITSYRGGKDYLKEYNFIIDEDKFLVLQSLFPAKEYNRFNSLFDYKGTVNLNFVNKEVFGLGVKLCNSTKDDMSSDIDAYWKVISEKHESNTTIKNINEIFTGTDGSRIEKYKKYNKFFSTDSFMFRIVISKDGNDFTVFLRKYKDSLRGKIIVEVFKTSVSNREFKIPEQDLSGDQSDDPKL